MLINENILQSSTLMKILRLSSTLIPFKRKNNNNNKNKWYLCNLPNWFLAYSKSDARLLCSIGSHRAFSECLFDVNQKPLDTYIVSEILCLLPLVVAIYFLTALWRIVLQNQFLLTFTVVNEIFVKVYVLWSHFKKIQNISEARSKKAR